MGFGYYGVEQMEGLGYLENSAVNGNVHSITTKSRW